MSTEYVAIVEAARNTYELGANTAEITPLGTRNVDEMLLLK
jgi:hypothetical protein